MFPFLPRRHALARSLGLAIFLALSLLSAQLGGLWHGLQHRLPAAGGAGLLLSADAAPQLEAPADESACALCVGFDQLAGLAGLPPPPVLAMSPAQAAPGMAVPGGLGARPPSARARGPPAPA